MGIRLQFSLGLVLAGVAIAEERKSTPAPAGETSIDAAKQGFDTIKALRQPGGQPKGDLPRIALPELPVSEREPTLFQTEKKPKTETLDERKAKNWLLEAMEKPVDSSQRKDPKDRSKSEDKQTMLVGMAENKTDEASVAAKVDSRSEAKTRKNDERESGPATINPLAGFMAGWMTPQDYALLQPKGDPAATKGARSSQADGLPAAGGFLAGSAGIGAVEGVTFTPANVGKQETPGAPRENPYLQTALPEPSPTTVLSQPLAVVAAGTVNAPRMLPGPTPAPEAPPRTTRPDFAKPLTDDKYFKPLKRF